MNRQQILAMRRRMGHFGVASSNPGQVTPGAAPSGANIHTDQYGTYQSNEKFWFTYQTSNIASLAPAGTTTNTITFDNDSVFVWTKLTWSADLTNAAITVSSVPVPYVTVQIQDTGQGAYYSNAQIPLQCYGSGAPGLPYVMPAPQEIAPNASLQFNFTNYSTAGGGNQTYNNLRLQLHGYKMMRRG